MDGQAELLAENAKLLDRGGPVDVERRQIRSLAALCAEPARELRGGRRLAGAVQADEHQHDGRGPAEVERDALLAEQPDQLAMDELDEVLLGREAPQHLFAEGVLLDGLDELLDDADVDVGLEERQPHVAERLLDVALGDLP